MDATEVEPLLLTKEDVARLLSTSTTNVDRLRRAGEITAVKFGDSRNVRYRAADIKAFVAGLSENHNL